MTASNKDFKPAPSAQQPSATVAATRPATNGSSGSKAIIDPTNVRNTQDFKSFLTNVDPNVMRQTLSPFLMTQDLGRLSTSCASLYSMHERDLRKRALQQLLQAVVDDDRVTAQKIVNSHPELLLIEPTEKKITSIESKYTFQRFLTEKALIMAQKLHRLEITKILVAAFEKLESSQATRKTDAKDEKTALQSQWVLPLLDEKQQQLANKKLQQQYRRDYFNPLISIIAADPCTDRKVNWATENVLNNLRTIILPEHPVAIDKYIDTEQFLAAAYAAHCEFSTLYSNPKRVVFSIYVLGLAQSLVSPELAKAYCHPKGLYEYAQNRNLPFNQHAMEMKFNDGSYYYRSTRISRSGVGFDSYFASYCESRDADSKRCWVRGGQGNHIEWGNVGAWCINELSRTRAEEFSKLTQRVLSSAKYGVRPMNSKCVIL